MSKGRERGGGGEGGRDRERERYLWWYRWKYLPFFIYNMAIFIYIKVDFVTFKVEWLCWTSYSFFGGVVILDSLEMMLLCDDVIMFRILALILIIYSQSRVHHGAM